MSRKIASHYTLLNGKLERNIVVEVDDSRTITAIEHVEAPDSCHGVEFYGGILIPGMVNAHCHLELSYLRGAIDEGLGFAGFAGEIGRVRNNYTPEERLRAAANADAQMWEEGIEAVVDIANDDLIMPIKEQSKIRYKTMFELFGLLKEDARHECALATKYADASVTPHSTYSLQDAPLKEICHSGEAPISLHFLESDDEIELYQRRGSLYAWYERMGWQCDFLHYGMPAERVVESVPKGRKVMLVHGCKATPIDIMTLDNHFDIPPPWVICPESNRYISGSKPPVELFRMMGSKVAIGSDSLASARSLSMMTNMRILDNIPIEELLCWATINGAKALGLEQELGSIEVGKRPGLVQLFGVDFEHMHLTEESFFQRIL